MSEKKITKEQERRRLYYKLCQHIEPFVRENASAYQEMAEEACEAAGWHLATAIEKLQHESALPHMVAEEIVNGRFFNAAHIRDEED